MPLLGRSDPVDNYDVQTERLIPYRENGEVKYMRADEAQDFSSTGGAAAPRKLSGWASLPSGFGTANAPNLLPERYTDESVVPVVVTDIVPTMKPEVKEKKSFIGKLKKDKGPSTTKVVFMTRLDYKKYFAKDREGNYIGTEPKREWTEEELDDEFGRYQKVL